MYVQERSFPLTVPSPSTQHPPLSFHLCRPLLLAVLLLLSSRRHIRRQLSPAYKMEFFCLSSSLHQNKIIDNNLSSAVDFVRQTVIHFSSTTCRPSSSIFVQSVYRHIDRRSVVASSNCVRLILFHLGIELSELSVRSVLPTFVSAGVDSSKPSSFNTVSICFRRLLPFGRLQFSSGCFVALGSSSLLSALSLIDDLRQLVGRCFDHSSYSSVRSTIDIVRRINYSFGTILRFVFASIHNELSAVSTRPRLFVDFVSRLFVASADLPRLDDSSQLWSSSCYS
jgi:hypothetical protein